MKRKWKWLQQSSPVITFIIKERESYKDRDSEAFISFSLMKRKGKQAVMELLFHYLLSPESIVWLLHFKSLPNN